MTDGQRLFILTASVLFAVVQLALGFQAFMNDDAGQNLFTILPAPIASLGIGLFIWMGRGRGGPPESRRGRIMKGPWQ